MRTVAILTLIVVFCSPAQAQEGQVTRKSDPYMVQLVQATLKLPAGITVSVIEKDLLRMGDKIGVALTKCFSEDQLKQPENIKRYLPLIRDAFSHQELIQDDDDKNPSVTLLVLQSVSRDLRDAKLREEIQLLTRSLRANRKPVKH